MGFFICDRCRKDLTKSSKVHTFRFVGHDPEKLINGIVVEGTLEDEVMLCDDCYESCLNFVINYEDMV